MNYGQNDEWQNPVILDRIKLESSGWHGGHKGGSINDMVGRATNKEQYSYSDNIKNGWIIVDFKSIRIKPTHYTLRHWNSGQYVDSMCMKSWNLLGSLDGMKYEIIDKHSYWISPFGKGKTKTFRIDDSNKYYQYFKIEITGKNSGGHRNSGSAPSDWCISFNDLEIYGYVRSNNL